jgi:Protein of unknown function (DUF1761)
MMINNWALLLAAVAGFMFGGVWYSQLSQPWLAALGKSEGELKRSARPMPLLFGITFAAQLVMAWVLAGLLLHLSKGGVSPTVRTGALTGAFCWLGFIATTLVTNHGYQGQSWRLTLIDGAYWLGVLLIQGTVIGAMGVR